MFRRILLLLSVAALMAVMLAVTASVALAASDQSCDNYSDKIVKISERITDGKLSEGDIQSHFNWRKNISGPC